MECSIVSLLSCFHPVLQDEHCSHPVYRAGALFDGEVGFAEEAVGLAGGQAFVPQVDWQAEFLAEFLGKKLHFLGLGSLKSA